MSADGYLDRVSYFPAETVKTFFHGKNSGPIDNCIYDVLGKCVVRVDKVRAQAQTRASDEPWKNGYAYEQTGEFVVPSLPTGVYRIGSAGFVVKARKPAEITVLLDSNTSNAYSTAGGKSLYASNSSKRVAATVLSWHRPIQIPSDYSLGCLKHFSKQARSMRYLAGIDMEEKDILKETKVLVLIGHNEYWTRNAREQVDEFINSGGHLLVLSGNTMWWQIRHDHKNNQIICYKNAEKDPEPDPLLKTIVWKTPSLRFSIIGTLGADFDGGGYGRTANDKGWDGYKITAANSPLLSNSGLRNGDLISISTHEYDGAPVKTSTSGNVPVLDMEKLPFKRAELIGYDRGYRGRHTTATWLVAQRAPNSGIVINVGTTDWCSDKGIDGPSGTAIKKITDNMLNALMNNQSVFSP